MPNITHSFKNLIVLDFNMLAKFYNNRTKIIDTMDSNLYSSDD